MMQSYGLPLARVGYWIYAFDFLEHGRYVLPMSGDVSKVNGPTRLLVAQTQAVMDALPIDEPPLAVIILSMATDILVRAAKELTGVGPMVMISAFSNQIDARFPKHVLLISGAWEGRLREVGLNAVKLVIPAANEGETVAQGDVMRCAVAAPFSEHVSILQSRVARAEAVTWFDQAYGRSSDVRILLTGWPILGSLCELMLLFRNLARRLLDVGIQLEGLSWRWHAKILVLGVSFPLFQS